MSVRRILGFEGSRKPIRCRERHCVNVRMTTHAYLIDAEVDTDVVGVSHFGRGTNGVHDLNRGEKMETRRNATSMIACLVAALVAAFWTSAPARSGEFDALKGREIRAIIGGKPGGGTDLMGRAFFAALDRLLPDTTIHIQTINGGAGAAAVKELSVAGGDLITISIFGNGPVYGQFLSDEKQEFDIGQLKWIGSLADNRRVVSMRKSLGEPRIETLRKMDRQPITPSSAAGSPNNIESLLINAITGTHLKVVPGFGSSQIDTMLIAGDADVRLSGSYQIEPLIESGDMVPILRLSDGAYGEVFQSLPKLEEVALPNTPSSLLLFLETLNKLGRPYAAAPNTSPAVVDALRAAFVVAVEDSEFKTYMASIGIVGGSTRGAGIQGAMDQLLTDTELKSTIQRYVDCGRAMSDDPKAQCT